MDVTLNVQADAFLKTEHTRPRRSTHRDRKKSAPARRAAVWAGPAGFRLPDATRVGAVHLQIANLARSIDFYRDVLGLVVIEQKPGVASLTPAAGDHPLVWLHEDAAVRPAPRRGVSRALSLRDPAPGPRRARSIRRASVTAGVRVGMADHLVSEALYLTDPDGLGIEVYVDRPRATWRHCDRELLMTTDPLDVADLIAAGAGQPWNGMPAGTTIGHMHLHVGNLDEAEAFYHRALGFDKTVWSYPGALFFVGGWLSPPPRHEHVVARAVRPP